MRTLTLTFKQGITKQIVLRSLSDRLENLPDKKDLLQSCCGSLAYLSLFLLPGFELEDKKIYSIESICTHVPGIFTMFMHDVLEQLGTIACGVDTKNALFKLLSCAGFYECFEMLGVVPKDWYRVFLYNYLDGRVEFSRLLSLQTYDSLASMFSSEIGENYSV